jgi:thymidylate synthase ThyX
MVGYGIVEVDEDRRIWLTDRTLERIVWFGNRKTD